MLDFGLHRRLRRVTGAEWKLHLEYSRLDTPSGVPISLTDSELRVLTPLLESAGLTVPREALLASLGQSNDYYAMRRLETMLSRLRKKILEASPEEPLPVRARHGNGYVFAADARV